MLNRPLHGGDSGGVHDGDDKDSMMMIASDNLFHIKLWNLLI